LPSTIDPANDLVAENAASDRTGLSVGLLWWIPAVILAALYFVNLFRLMRGKVKASEYGH
jgi:hypothetical protein